MRERLRMDQKVNKDEIVKGGVYVSGGKRRVIRRIIDAWKYPYGLINEKDHVRYEILHDGLDRPQRVGRFKNSSRQAFARWAKERMF
jgi:hypothetical protein